MTEVQPYLSVVAATRNDNHGVDLLHRMQVFVDAFVAQCDAHAIDAELILVEWNPPADRARLIDVVNWPQGSGHTTIRIIEVPHALHEQLDNAERLAFFQMIAKNVGIRRARAPFVLATNVDLLFSDELMRFIAARRLRAGRYYRVDRYDVAADLPGDVPIVDQLRWCRSHVIRICARRGTRDLRTGIFYPIYNSVADVPIFVWQWARRVARAQLARQRVLVGAPRRGLTSLLARLRSLTTRLQRASSRSLRTITSLRVGEISVARIRRVARRGTRRTLRRVASWRPGNRLRLGAKRIAAVATRVERRTAAMIATVAAVPARIRRLLDRASVRLHTNACGDFTLMAKEDWFRVEGYPELPIFSLHIDSLLLYQAHYAGIGEAYLREEVFHIEHESGFKPDEEGRRLLADWVDGAGIPQITNAQFAEWVVTMKRQSAPLPFNEANWGFADAVLDEHRFTV